MLGYLNTEVGMNRTVVVQARLREYIFFVFLSVAKLKSECKQKNFKRI